MRRALLLLVALPALASAHTLDVPKRDSVRIEPGAIAVSVDFLLDGAESARLRAAYDTNRNGVLDETERDAFAKWIVLAATHALEVRADAARLMLREDAGAREIRGLADRVSAASEIRAIVVMEGELPARVRHVEITDRNRDASIPLPITVSLAGGVKTAAGGTSAQAEQRLAVDIAAP